MARSSDPTRTRILDAASRLFYAEGIRAVSVDAVAEKAGITKKTLYYHFRSKDDLVAAYLAARDQPNLALFKRWFDEDTGAVPDKVAAIFRHLAEAARHPRWRGCGFLRTTAELANLPGHPAIRIGAAHKKKFEAWLQAMFADAGIAGSGELARQMLLLLDGAFAVVLLHRDASYMETAGEAARTLVAAALPRRTRSPRSRQPAVTPSAPAAGAA
ncbi:TetR/AcrR family transcriptional regulator [Bradyrhizobium sp. STM 3809]|uniref:TetR/AcrR family transcriptional regulator n=1 Tax=Bradyrhizobium sp. STM 3809 TaxID=551936 RepID=UPI00024096EA|nr:TetR/AcrR family transcriptional regulator [Bradyrhizobium sp. STM 3809]CCD97977.1 putative transcriptional regulator, TetR family [Bradyrhizobium sp. STM 3809]